MNCKPATPDKDKQRRIKAYNNILFQAADPKYWERKRINSGNPVSAASHWYSQIASLNTIVLLTNAERKGRIEFEQISMRSLNGCMKHLRVQLQEWAETVLRLRHVEISTVLALN